MKSINVIGMGLAAVALFVSAESKAISTDVDFWTGACADKNVALIQYMDKNKKVFYAHAKSQDEMNALDAARSEFDAACGKFTAEYIQNTPDHDNYMGDLSYEAMSAHIERDGAKYKETIRSIHQGAAGKAIAQEAIRQEQAQQAQQVNRGTPAERLQAMQACQMDPQVQGYIINKRELQSMYNAQLQDFVRDMVNSGYTQREAVMQAAETYRPMRQQVDQAVRDSNQAIGDCVKQNYGIDLY